MEVLSSEIFPLMLVASLRDGGLSLLVKNLSLRTSSSHYSTFAPLFRALQGEKDSKYWFRGATSTADALLQMNITRPLRCFLQSIKVLHVLHKRVLISELRNRLNERQCRILRSFPGRAEHKRWLSSRMMHQDICDVKDFVF